MAASSTARMTKIAKKWVTDATPDTKLTEAGMDSLDFVEMIFDIEEEFNVDCDDDEWLMKANTPAAIAAVIDAAVAGKAKKGSPVRVRAAASR